MARRLSKKEAREMSEARKVKSGGRNGGGYPKDHDGSNDECGCSGCMRRRLIAAEELAEKRRVALEVLERVKRVERRYLDATPPNPGSGIGKATVETVERPDLDKSQDWGA
jgi:hypothetical protein